MKLFAKGNSIHRPSTGPTNGTRSNLVGSLTDLPHELLLQILDELDDAALCELGSTCKDFNNLIFPLFFHKHQITNPSQGWLSCYRAPEHTLRAIRCSLVAKNISNIHYYFNKGIDRLVEEVKEMHAIVKRTDEVTDFKVYLLDLDDWAMRDARDHELDETQVLRLTSEEWTKLYLGLLTASLTKGCKDVLLSGGAQFWEYLQTRDRRQITRLESLPGGSSKKRVLGRETARYFDDTVHNESPLGGQSKPHLAAQSIAKLSPENTAVAELTAPKVLEGNSASNSLTLQTVRDTKARILDRVMKWIAFFPRKNRNINQVEAPGSSTTAHCTKDFDTVSPVSNLIFRLSDLSKSSTHSTAPAPARTMGRPTPMMERLILRSDMFFASPSFLDWTNQLLSWCAPTLTHLELQCLETPSRTWSEIFSEATLPSLIRFEIACNLVIGAANIQGSDILGFLGRHPSIQKLYLHGVQVPAGLCDLPKAGKPILPNLVEVTAHPMYIRWFLNDEEQCPKLEEVVLLTEYYASFNRSFAYEVLDKALEDLLPRSHKLDVIGFKFTNDHHDLDSWLQSHVDAGPNTSILSSFINTKHLSINAAHYVKIINTGYRLELVAQFVGLFPNLDYLELKDQPGASYSETGHIPPVVEALRLHSPQVKKVKINIQTPIHVAEFERK